MTPRDDVIISYSGMADGTTMSSQLCPMCKGGSSKERSMSVGMSGASLWWVCHRSRCGFKGRHNVLGNLGDNPTTTDERRSRHREFRRERLPKDVRLMLAERMKVDPGTIDDYHWSYTADYAGHGPRVIFPIRSPDGTLRGEVFRSYWGAEPKALTNRMIDAPEIAWHVVQKYPHTVVVVEDVPSACRFNSCGVDSVALLGASLSERSAREIRDAGYKKVVMCLDGDASDSAIKQAIELRKILPGLMVKLLGDVDIKDMPQQDLDIVVNEIRRM